jgi:hypothetical protein
MKPRTVSLAGAAALIVAACAAPAAERPAPAAPVADASADCRISQTGLREQLATAVARTEPSSDDTRVANLTLAVYGICGRYWYDPGVVDLPPGALDQATGLAERGTTFAPTSTDAAETFAKATALADAASSPRRARAACHYADLAPADAAAPLARASDLAASGDRAGALTRLHAAYARAATDAARFQILDALLASPIAGTDAELARFPRDAVRRYREELVARAARDEAAQRDAAARAREEAERAQAERETATRSTSTDDRSTATTEAANTDGAVTTTTQPWPTATCLDGYGTHACGYDCRAEYGQVRCAQTPFGACGAAYGTLVCFDPSRDVLAREPVIRAAECRAEYGTIACGYGCAADYGSVKCAATPEGVCHAANGEVTCFDPPAPPGRRPRDD